MKTILILMDSLNRHMLETYDRKTWVKTPNIKRLEEKSITFDNHWLGSAPCMPARRDMLTGRLNFLERNWGPIEPFDITLQEKLRETGVFTHIITDHTHYVEKGGSNYLQSFNTWDIHRGQENDTWVSRVNSPKLPEEYYGKATAQYELNRSRFINEEDYSTPGTFISACKWIEDNKDADDFFLQVEVFDPHEPFDSPDHYLEMYEDDYDGPRFEWSSYAPVEEPEEAIKHLRNKYAATMTMADKWLGKFLDTLEENNMFEDTLIMLTSDHGHLLGEHGWTGKNNMHAYNEIAHLPLLISLPGNESSGERKDAITQNIDLMPTILEYYNIEIPDCIHGQSLKGMLEGNKEKNKEFALYGWHGKAVNITDGEYTYFRAPNDNNYPCYNYCAIPTSLFRYLGQDCKKQIEMGRFLKHTDYPVYKIPISDSNTHIGGVKYIKDSLLFNIKKDYKQIHSIQDKDIERDYVNKLKKIMVKYDSPEEQFTRLGLD